ncbi:class I SAM-dependent methyltransferase [Methylobacterium aquaticum]|uniref:class I SAM-dependent methyltransferase n=1 Tax=Methylobacterium aquaticum TaxID=270351 RepID=UPI000A5B15DD|nr:class I SAM-dependent methyltransferase [Methylobacterium aquaticum]
MKIERIAGWNTATRSCWERYSAHRENLMRLIRQHAVTRGSITILGAGNCNDIDLAELFNLFSVVNLIDIDLKSLEYATCRYPISGNNFNLIVSDISIPPKIEPCLIRSSDLVLSACVVSQLVAQEDRNHRDLSNEFFRNIWWNHFDWIEILTSPNGRALIISDVGMVLNRCDIEDNIDRRINIARFAGVDSIAINRNLLDHPKSRSTFYPPLKLTDWNWNQSDRGLLFVEAYRLERVLCRYHV